MFKVVPDQLRISDGWVRCGQCQKVFDAKAHLYTELPQPNATKTWEAHATGSASPDEASALPVSQTSTTLLAETDAAAVNVYEPSTPAPMASQEGASDLPSSGTAVLDDFLSRSPAALESHLPVDTGIHMFEVTRQEEQPVATSDASVAHKPQATQFARSQFPKLEEFSFMRQARKAHFWHLWPVRIVLGSSCLLLLLGLLAQIAINERHRWAAYYPEVAPALHALCGTLACAITPLKDIDALVIDSSSFTKVRSNIYRLQLSLKNTGKVALAPPSIELTLTDMQDQALIRRVVSPEDLGFTTPTMLPHSERAVVLPVEVQISIAADKISGYRILAFYP